MKWRDWIPPIFQRKASEINRLITAFFLGEPVWTPVNFENLAREGFEKNVWVYRCVMEIAKAGSNIPFILYQKRKSGGIKEIEQHELLDLLRRPNPFMSKQLFMENIIAFLQLSGNAYFQHVGPNNGSPKELWVFRPDRVKIIPDRKNLIGGYRYSVNGLYQDFKPDIVSHVKLFSALDDFYGLSPIQVAARSIDIDNYSNEWNASLLQNGARPSGAMVTENTLSEDQYNRLKSEIDSQYKGSKNRGKPMLLEGGLDWKEMSLSPQEMDFLNSKSVTRLEIASAFGVPPELLGDHEHATYSNYQEARKGFYHETVIPTVNKVLDVINTDLVPKFGDNLYLEIDYDRIDALQEDRDKVWDRTIRAVQAGLLEVNEGRQAMGYESIKGGNVRYVPMGIIPEGEDAPDLLGSMNSNSDSNNNIDNNNDDNDDNGSKGMELKALNLRYPVEKKQYWRGFDRRRYGFYGSSAKLIARRFDEERKGVLKAFDDGGMEKVEQYLDDNLGKWTKTMTAVWVSVMDAFGSDVFDSIMGNEKRDRSSIEKKESDQESLDDTELQPSFDVFDSYVQEYIASVVANKVVGINDTTKKMIKAIVLKGFEDNLTLYEIRDEIEKLYLEQIIPNRSMTIARTEVIGASNAGSHMAAKQTGLILEKEWVATEDDRTRHSHRVADGQRKDIDEPFEVGNSSLKFPGDPHGKPEEVINCRCTQVYHTKK